jgi:hypothetical protein
MVFGFRIRQSEKRNSSKNNSDYRMDALVKLGRDQFKKLLEKGISIPVVLL